MGANPQYGSNSLDKVLKKVIDQDSDITDLILPMTAQDDPDAITDYVKVTNMTEPVAKAEGEAVSAALETLRDEVSSMQGTLEFLMIKLRGAGLLRP